MTTVPTTTTFALFDATTGDDIGNGMSLLTLYHTLRSVAINDPEREVFIGDNGFDPDDPDAEGEGFMTGWPLAQQIAAVREALRMQTDTARRQAYAAMLAAEDKLRFAQRDYDAALAAYKAADAADAKRDFETTYLADVQDDANA